MKLSSRNWCAAMALALAALAGGAGRAEAQQGTVRGTVTDSSSRRGVPGVRLTVAGATQNAVTNDEGVYVLRGLPSGDVTIRAQRIGFAAMERRVSVAPGAEVVADFELRPVATRLSEIVSLGYGSASRANVSAAISSVTAEDIANTPTAGVDAALQGKMPGVQVMQNAGNPGNGISIRIRGPASVNAGNQPLYVVDGIPIQQDNFTQLGLGGQDITAVTGINPDEIASIDVLKDGASAAIYGSRGSNGVVLITTKRGQAGKPKITFNAYGGQQRTEKTIGLVNAKEYVELYNESSRLDGRAPSRDPFVAGVDDTASYDWQDAVFRTAPVSDIQLGVSGGGDRSQYYVSGSNFDQKGIVIGSRYQRQAARVNLDFNATTRTYLRTSVALTREDNDRIEGDGSSYGVLTNAIGMQPMRPIYDADGNYAGEDEDLLYSNPVQMAALNPTNLKTLRAMGNIEGRYLFSDRISLTARAGADVLGVDESQWQSPLVDNTYAASNNGVGKSGHQTANKYVLESFATVDPLRTETQSLSLLGGASVEYNHRELNFIRGEAFPSGFTKLYVRNAGIVTEYDGSASDWNLVSFYSRANYSFANRYLLSGSVRYDGSSRFGADNRYGVFPAISAGWLVSEEGFAEGLRRMASLKLRASYGLTGNLPNEDFAARSLARGRPYSGEAGTAADQLGNPNLRWEKTAEFDLGSDLYFFGGRLGLIADFYNRQTSNLLVQRPITAVSGYSTIWDNVGAIRNRGFDFALQTVNFKASDDRGFGWTTDLNVTFNRNEVTELYGGQPIVSGINGRETSIVAVGHPLGSFYMLRFGGVDPADGSAILSDAKEIVGDPQPDYFGGFTNNFTLRNFDLRTFLQFSKGNDVFNMMRIFTDDGGCTWDNLSTIVLDRWQKPGDITDVPRMSYNCRSGADAISSRFIEDGSYLRIGEITLGYRLPASWASMARMTNARVYFSGRNLHTFTHYSGYNPDVNSAGSDANIVMGTDYYAYPLARTFSLGVSAGW